MNIIVLRREVIRLRDVLSRLEGQRAKAKDKVRWDNDKGQRMRDACENHWRAQCELARKVGIEEYLDRELARYAEAQGERNGWE